MCWNMCYVVVENACRFLSHVMESVGQNLFIICEVLSYFHVKSLSCARWVKSKKVREVRLFGHANCHWWRGFIVCEVLHWQFLLTWTKSKIYKIIFLMKCLFGRYKYKWISVEEGMWLMSHTHKLERRYWTFLNMLMQECKFMMTYRTFYGHGRAFFRSVRVHQISSNGAPILIPCYSHDISYSLITQCVNLLTYKNNKPRSEYST